MRFARAANSLPQSLFVTATASSAMADAGPV